MSDSIFTKPLGELVQKRPVIELRHDTTVATALEILERNNISSVPVRDIGDAMTPGNPDTAKVLGIVNLMDLVSFVVFNIAEGDPLLRVDAGNLDKLDKPVSDLI